MVEIEEHIIAAIEAVSVNAEQGSDLVILVMYGLLWRGSSSMRSVNIRLRDAGQYFPKLKKELIYRKSKYTSR